VSGRVVEVYELQVKPLRQIRVCARHWETDPMDNPPAAKQKTGGQHRESQAGKAVQSDRRFVAYKSANRKISHPAQKSQEKAVRKRRDDNWRPVMLVGKDASEEPLG
jgi:hypothetical protein